MWELTERTHHDTSIKTLSANSYDNVFSDALEHFTSTENEAVGMSSVAVLAMFHELCIRNFLDSVGFSRSTRLVTFDIMAREEDAIARNNFTRFQKCNIANKDFL